MLPDYAKSKEMQNVSSIKAIVAMARVTDTAPPPSDMTSAVACFGSQSFTQSEHVALQAEARRIFGSYSPSGGYNQTDAGKLCFKEIHRWNLSIVLHLEMNILDSWNSSVDQIDFEIVPNI